MSEERKLPEDLGGYQQLDCGVVFADDLIVEGDERIKRWPLPKEVSTLILGHERRIVGHDFKVYGVTVYRKIPVPRHLSPELKPSNPKDAIGSDKLPLHLWPTTATAHGCLALLDGMLKYGRSNFRAIGVRSSIYYDAGRRHFDAWFEGEDVDPDSGLSHLAHVLACVAIILDAQAAGKLTDDRVLPANYRALVESLTPHVARLKGKHAERKPKHYTINDR